MIDDSSSQGTICWWCDYRPVKTTCPNPATALTESEMEGRRDMPALSNLGRLANDPSKVMICSDADANDIKFSKQSYDM